MLHDISHSVMSALQGMPPYIHAARSLVTSKSLVPVAASNQRGFDKRTDGTWQHSQGHFLECALRMIFSVESDENGPGAEGLCMLTVVTEDSSPPNPKAQHAQPLNGLVQDAVHLRERARVAHGLRCRSIVAHHCLDCIGSRGTATGCSAFLIGNRSKGHGK